MIIRIAEADGLYFSRESDQKANGRSSICYLTVLKCQLPTSTYSTPAISITRPNALLFSPTIEESYMNFCRMHEQA
ncbi:hypothetical protein VTL71DRAFT_10710 [Oculimacula yallundae]|uniref:Uncharacterized protein n=1 Tax=Oculimacula yallundae TaxID=86028 RepID=A0ABR4CV98_9HELO